MIFSGSISEIILLYPS